jgi:hypothetical protein
MQIILKGHQRCIPASKKNTGKVSLENRSDQRCY